MNKLGMVFWSLYTMETARSIMNSTTMLGYMLYALCMVVGLTSVIKHRTKQVIKSR